MILDIVGTFYMLVCLGFELFGSGLGAREWELRTWENYKRLGLKYYYG